MAEKNTKVEWKWHNKQNAGTDKGFHLVTAKHPFPKPGSIDDLHCVILNPKISTWFKVKLFLLKFKFWKSKPTITHMSGE